MEKYTGMVLSGSKAGVSYSMESPYLRLHDSSEYGLLKILDETNSIPVVRAHQIREFFYYELYINNRAYGFWIPVDIPNSRIDEYIMDMLIGGFKRPNLMRYL